MLSCKDTTKLLSQSLDAELSLPQRLALRLHLAICRNCRNFREHLALIHEACRRFSESGDELSGVKLSDI